MRIKMFRRFGVDIPERLYYYQSVLRNIVHLKDVIRTKQRTFDCRKGIVEKGIAERGRIHDSVGFQG